MMNGFRTDLAFGNENNIFKQDAFDHGFTVAKQDIRIEDFDGFMAMAAIDFAIIDSSTYDNVVLLTSEKARLRVTHKSGLVACFLDRAGLEWFFARYKGFLKQFSANSVSVFYHYLHKGDTTDRFIELDLNKMPRIYPELYPDIDVSLLVEDFKSADESVLILFGVPGVGKTTFLKHLLATGGYKKIAYIKDMEVMKKSDFWSGIAASNYDLLIFDDLDFAVGPRSEGDNGFVTNLLSYSDGIFNDRSKIVITTNQSIERIDEALIRPGRCFDFLILKPLSREEAMHVWSEVLGREPVAFLAYFENHDKITQAALMAAYRKEMASLRGRRYMKNDSDVSIHATLAEAGVSVASRKTGFRA